VINNNRIEELDNANYLPAATFAKKGEKARNGRFCKCRKVRQIWTRLFHFGPLLSATVSMAKEGEREFSAIWRLRLAGREHKSRHHGRWVAGPVIITKRQAPAESDPEGGDVDHPSVMDSPGSGRFDFYFSLWGASKIHSNSSEVEENRRNWDERKRR